LNTVAQRCACVASALFALASLANAQAPARVSLEELAHTRIDGDRSAVCVQIARIELGAAPEVATADECASKRADRPITNARFEIGSISKVFVGLLIAEMVERGEMKLDETLEAIRAEMDQAYEAEKHAQQRIKWLTELLIERAAGLADGGPTGRFRIVNSP